MNASKVERMQSPGVDDERRSVCIHSKRREEKKNIFLTYGANRFLLKCLDSFDKRFFFALHISRLFLFHEITIQTFENSSLNAGIWEGTDIMWPGDFFVPQQQQSGETSLVLRSGNNKTSPYGSRSRFVYPSRSLLSARTKSPLK